MLSDVHLAHPSRDITESIDALNTWLYESHTDFNYLVISGDLFDRGLSFTGTGITPIITWFMNVCQYASQQDITIRILEGTRLHDRRQAERLVGIAKHLYPSVDLSYHYDLTIERHPIYGHTTLYLRDEYPGTREQIEVEIRDAMKAMGITSVDWVIMHGNMSYHLPEIAHAPYYDEQFFLSICTGPIIIGHNHQHRIDYERIITPGSFDALTHMDTYPVGGGCLTYDTKSGEWDYTFLANKQSQLFVTLVANTLAEVKIGIEGLPNKRTHLRVYCGSADSRNELKVQLVREYPHFQVKVLEEKTKTSETTVMVTHSIATAFSLESALSSIVNSFSGEEQAIARQILEDTVTALQKGG